MTRLILPFLILILLSPSYAQSFNGSYELQGNKLDLSQSGQSVTGTLQTTEGETFKITSEISGGEALGSIEGTESLEFFGAYFEGGGLSVIIAPMVLGVPDLQSGQLFQFQKSAAQAATPAQAVTPATPPRQVNPAAKSTSSAPSPPVKPLKESGSAQLSGAQKYQSGTRVKDHDSGVSFVVPQDWFGGVPDNSDGFVMCSNTDAGIGLVYLRQQTTMQQAEALLNTAQDLGDGVMMQPTGITRSTNGFEVDYSSGAYYGKVVARFGNGGNGAAAFWAGPAKDRARYEELARQVAGSFQFNKPTVSSKVAEWQNLLRGRKLRQLSSYSSTGYGDGSYAGSSSSTTLHLCSNGRYSYASSSSFSVDAGEAGFD